MLQTDNLKLERRGSSALLTLTRPQRLNALSAGLVNDLHRAIAEIAADRSIRAVVVTGEGRGFCAGLDLREAAWPGLEGLDSVSGGLVLQQRIASLVPAMREAPQPFIAAVNGPACGGGLALALACDVRYGAPEARFNVAFVKLGVSGCDIGVSYLLPRLVGTGHAYELSLTGRLIDAEEALRIGLINRIVPSPELTGACCALAEEMAANTPYAVEMTKQVLDRNLDAASLRAAIELENRTQVLGTHTQSSQALFADWKGKDTDADR